MRAIVKDGIAFDKEDIEKNLTLFLYPDDSDEQGQTASYLSAVFHGKQRCTADP